MNNIDFWKVIARINWTEESDEKRMLPVLELLKSKNEAEIISFQENLAYKLFTLDTKEHAMHIGEFSYKNEETHFSNDFFLYVRCCVVANGKEYYEKVLKNPKEMPKDMGFEPLLYIGEEAFEQKSQKEWNHETKYDYETYSNENGWK